MASPVQYVLARAGMSWPAVVAAQVLLKKDTPMTQDRQTSSRVGHDAPASGTAVGAQTTARMADVDSPHRPESRPAKTSAAAVFSLVFGLAALFCALTAILSPVAGRRSPSSSASSASCSASSV